MPSDNPPASVLSPGSLTLAATPLGNPLDASLRLIRALEDADLIAAEDTRRLKRLATDLGVRLTARTIAYHEHNEREKTAELFDAVRGGAKVLIVTDAGMPVISDPGYRAVVAAIDEGLPFDVFPGPSAPLTALVHSGLAPERFAFEGFVPRTGGKRSAFLESLAKDARTLIFFESPRRTEDTLLAMRDAFGADRRAVIARELTKTYQECVRGSLAELVDWAKGGVLGEIVILVEGARQDASVEDVMDELVALIDSGERAKIAAKTIAAAHPGVRARELYEAYLALKESGV